MSSSAIIDAVVCSTTSPLLSACIHTVHPLSPPTCDDKCVCRSPTLTGDCASTERDAFNRGSTSRCTGCFGCRYVASNVGIVVRFEIAHVVVTCMDSTTRPLVSTTQASVGSAIRKLLQYGRLGASPRVSWPLPPCPYVVINSESTCTASYAVAARSKPNRTRSMPINASGAVRGSSMV